MVLGGPDRGDDREHAVKHGVDREQQNQGAKRDPWEQKGREPDSLRRDRAVHGATPYSTSSSQNRYGPSPSSNVAALSAPPTASQRQSTDARSRSGSNSPTPEGSG